MKDTAIIGLACALAIVVGVWLLLSGEGASPLSSVTPNGPVSFTTLQEGQDAGGMTERKNFRIKSAEELQQLWGMMYSSGGPAIEHIDFTTKEVLAVFDGTHTTGGYGVAVDTVDDTDASRTVVIRRTVPGESCATTQAITSPFTIIVLSRSALPIVRIEQTEVEECK